MATTLQKSYEVEAFTSTKVNAFVMFDYETREAIASLEYNGRAAVKRTFKSKEGIEYAAIEMAAYQVADNANIRNNAVTTRIYYMMECLADAVSHKVDAYLNN